MQEIYGKLLVQRFPQEAATLIPELPSRYGGPVNSFSLGNKKKSAWAMAEVGGVG